MRKDPSKVGPKAYITRWGSWRKALLALQGFRGRSQVSRLSLDSKGTLALRRQ